MSSILRFANWWKQNIVSWESQDVLADPMVDYHWNTDIILG